MFKGLLDGATSVAVHFGVTPRWAVVAAKTGQVRNGGDGDGRGQSERNGNQ